MRTWATARWFWPSWEGQCRTVHGSVARTATVAAKTWPWRRDHTTVWESDAGTDMGRGLYLGVRESGNDYGFVGIAVDLAVRASCAVLLIRLTHYPQGTPQQATLAVRSRWNVRAKVRLTAWA